MGWPHLGKDECRSAGLDMGQRRDAGPGGEGLDTGYFGALLEHPI